MAFFANHLSFFFLLITLLYTLQIHARDSQFFNKIPTTNNDGHIEKETKVVTPNKDQEPNFIPENENAYGVYDHESSQLPPSTPTTNLIPNNKYLPKNYNPVAYVTVPEDNTDETNDNQYYNSDNTDHHYYRGDHNTYDNNNNDNNNNQYYYNSENTYDHYYRGDSMYDNKDDDNNNQYYNGVNTYNDQYHNGGRGGSKVTSSIEPSMNYDSREYYYNNYDQLQDMSEPRLMDKGTTTTTTNNPTNTNYYPYKNGGKSYYNNNQEQSSNKYSYDANTEKYVKNPYENSREFANSYIANNELSNYNNNFVNYHENEEEFQDEEHMP